MSAVKEKGAIMTRVWFPWCANAGTAFWENINGKLLNDYYAKKGYWYYEIRLYMNQKIKVSVQATTQRVKVFQKYRRPYSALDDYSNSMLCKRQLKVRRKKS